jgi:hypothetical protein
MRITATETIPGIIDLSALERLYESNPIERESFRVSIGPKQSIVVDDKYYTLHQIQVALDRGWITISDFDQQTAFEEEISSPESTTSNLNLTKVEIWNRADYPQDAFTKYNENMNKLDAAVSNASSDWGSISGNVYSQIDLFDVFLTSSNASSNYLKLDASNTPMRGGLDMGGHSIFSCSNIGIGTDSPEEILHVSAEASPTLALENRGSSTFAKLLAGDVGATFGYSSGLDFKIGTFSSIADTAIDDTRLIIKNTTGNVGIGTDSPTAKLQVFGDGITSSNTGGAGILRADRTSGKISALVSGSSGSAFYFDETGFMSFVATSRSMIEGTRFSGGQTFMQLLPSTNVVSLFPDNDGNVGIGTTTPTEKLDVHGNLNLGVDLAGSRADDRRKLSRMSSAHYSNDEKNMALFVGDVQSDSFSKITFGGGTGAFNKPTEIHFVTASTATAIEGGSGNDVGDLVIKQGNVGIGTTSPTEKTEIDGNLFLNGDNDKILLGTGKDASISYDGTNMVFDSQEVGAGDFVFNNGNVGIGETSPSALLHVGDDYNAVGGVTPRMILSTNDNSIQSFHLENTSAAASAEMRFVVRANDGDYMAFTNPSSGNSGSFFGIPKKDNSFLFSNGRPLVFGTIRDDDIKFGYGNDTIAMTINGGTGNVGIGTDSPVSPLEVFGNTDVSDSGSGTVAQFTTDSEDTGITANYGILALVNKNNTTDNVAKITFSGDANGGNAVAQIITKFTNRTSKYGELSFGTRGSGGFAERMLIDSDGNVGIGTTTPTEKLEIDGNLFLSNDNDEIIQGAGKDFSQYFDGTNQNFDLTSGDFVFSATSGNFIFENGLAGFGTNDPQAQLHFKSGNSGTTSFDPNTNFIMEGSTCSRLTFVTADNGKAGIAWGDVSDSFVSAITYDHGINQLQFYVNNSNRLFINSNGDISIPADNAKLYQGAGDDMSSYYDGTSGWIKADEVAPSDLKISCGTDKTIELQETVWKDINIAGALLSKPSSSAPDTDTFRTSAGTDTGIETYAFAVGEKVHGGFELQHDYKEGTDLLFHVHYQIIDAPTGTDNVQFRLTYILQRDGVTLATVTTIDTPDCPVDTQYMAYRCDFGDITGTNFKIGDQMMFTLERVASDGDAFAGDILIETAGIHYQVDTLGSRQIGIK